MSNVLKEQVALKQVDAHTYSVGYSDEWTMGAMLHGGCIAATLYTVAEAHFNSTLASHRQPDVQTLHIEFFRACTAHASTVKVTDLKIGKGSCFIQLDLSQNGESKCTALATSTNFDISFGPSVSYDVPFLHAPRPIPDFAKIEAHEPDENWIPSKARAEFFSISNRMTTLFPRDGNPIDGVADYWVVFDRPEKMNGAHLALFCDCAPSMSDTLLRNGGLYDAHRIHAFSKAEAEKAPGKPAIKRLTLKEAGKASVWNSTLTMDMHFKRRMPQEQMSWAFTRVTTRMLQGGRMDLDFIICDKNLAPIAVARQAIAVIDASRRFKKGDKNETSKL